MRSDNHPPFGGRLYIDASSMRRCLAFVGWNREAHDQISVFNDHAVPHNLLLGHPSVAKKVQVPHDRLLRRRPFSKRTRYVARWRRRFETNHSGAQGQIRSAPTRPWFLGPGSAFREPRPSRALWTADPSCSTLAYTVRDGSPRGGGTGLSSKKPIHGGSFGSPSFSASSGPIGFAPKLSGRLTVRSGESIAERTSSALGGSLTQPPLADDPAAGSS